MAFHRVPDNNRAKQVHPNSDDEIKQQKRPHLCFGECRGKQNPTPNRDLNRKIAFLCCRLLCYCSPLGRRINRLGKVKVTVNSCLSMSSLFEFHNMMIDRMSNVVKLRLHCSVYTLSHSFSESHIGIS